MSAPHGMNPSRYEMWNRQHNLALKDDLLYSERKLEEYRQDVQIIKHILAEREAAKLYPSAERCRDCTEEAKRL